MIYYSFREVVAFLESCLRRIYRIYIYIYIDVFLRNGKLLLKRRDAKTIDLRKTPKWTPKRNGKKMPVDNKD